MTPQDHLWAIRAMDPFQHHTCNMSLRSVMSFLPIPRESLHRGPRTLEPLEVA